MADPSNPAAKARLRRRHRRRTTVSLLAIGALLAVGGGIAFATRGTAAPSYRIALAGMGSVEQSTTSPGTVGYVQKATAAFPVAGTVAGVGVQVGQSVKAGQVIATLDNTSLRAAITSATQTLGIDQQTLAADLVSQTQSAPATSTSTSTSATAPPAAAAGSGSSGSSGGSGGSGGSASGAGSGALVAQSASGGSALSGRSGGSANGTSSSTRSGGAQGAPAPTTTSAPTTPSGAHATSTQQLLAAVQAAQQKVTEGQAAIDTLMTGIVAEPTAAQPGSGGQQGSGGRPGGSGTKTGSTRAPGGPTGNPPAVPPKSRTATEPTKSQAVLIQEEVTACTPISTLTFESPAPGSSGHGPSGPPVSDSRPPGSSSSSTVGRGSAPSTLLTSSADPTTAPSTSTSPGSTHNAAAAFVPLAPQTGAAIDDVVLDHGDPIGAAQIAYRLIAADTAASTADSTTGADVPTATTPTDPATVTTTATVTATSSVTVAPSTVTTTETPATTTETTTETTTVTATVPDSGTGSSSTPTTSTSTSSGTATPTTSSPASSPATPTETSTATTHSSATTTPGGAGGARAAKELAACQAAIGAVLSNQTAVATAERDQSANLAALDTAIGRLQAAGETGSPGSGKTGTGAPRSGQSGQLTGQTGAPSGTGAAGSRTPGTATGSGTGIGTAGGIGTGADSSGRGGSSSRTGTPTTASGNQVGGAGTGGSPTGQGQGGGQGGGQKGGGNNAAPKIATAADIAADQAQLDLDEADIAVARQNLTEASLTSPIVGTVAAVGISKGESVNANSTSQTITVLGPGQYKVSTTIGLSLIDQLKVGDTARVTVNGVLTPLTGKVTMIGVLSDSSSSGSTTYPVTVLLDPSAQSLYEGSGASVAITLSQVSNVLTVPTSAVHTTGSVHTVSVVENGTARTVVVQVGAVGVDLTEITSGVTAGQQVVIADLDQPLATSSVASRAGFGGVGGAGLGGAGGAPPGGGRLVRPGG